MNIKRGSDRAAYIRAAKSAAQKHNSQLEVSVRGIGNVFKSNLDLPHPSTNDLLSNLLGQLEKKQNR